jgi:hypothetical protein
MYFDSIPANEWIFKDAVELYLIEFRDQRKAEAQMKRDLSAIGKNPNILKATKDRAAQWLSNFLVSPF